jgi:fructokinase
LIAAVEAGGTKFICAIGDETGRLLSEERIATMDPPATLAAMLASLRRQSATHGKITSIGVGSFGPVELDRTSEHFGYILRTPKPGWRMIDLAGTLSREFSCPVGFDTDVNAAAIGEHRWGAARDVDDVTYVTVGTGIGGGALVAGMPVHGLLHPEIGHIHPRRHAADRDFNGVCPFHGDCLEGLASGPAIIARSGASLDRLDEHHPQWDIQADYLGQLCMTLVLTTSPRRIVLGGGVMSQTRLLPMIRDRTKHWLHGYVDRPQVLEGLDEFIVAPALGAQAGVLGALALGIDAAKQPAAARVRLA